MKKRIFATFLILALLLAALAGCGQENGGASKSSGKDEEAEQLLGKGWYVVYDEDDELAGYLEVKSSKITVYNEVADEEDTLRYEYNAKKDLYILENGKLFGSEEFTVEKHKKVLTLITEDEDEYTLEEIDKDEIGGAAPASANPPATYQRALTPGYYAVTDEDKNFAGYLEVTSTKIISYDEYGNEQDSQRYDFDEKNDLYTFSDGEEFTVKHNGGLLTVTTDDGYRLILEPIDEREIGGGMANNNSPTETPPPVQTDAPAFSNSNFYIGDNGYFALYADLPDLLRYHMDTDHDDGVFSAMAAAYDADAAAELVFYSVLSSGDNLKEAVSTAKELYTGAYGSDAELLYGFLRDSMVTSGLEQGYLLDEYLGDDLDYSLLEDSIEINGVDWRYCDVYLSADGAEGYVSLMFWMEGGDMAVVVLGGIAEDADNAAEMYNRVFEIMFSLELLP